LKGYSICHLDKGRKSRYLGGKREATTSSASGGGGGLTEKKRKVFHNELALPGKERRQLRRGYGAPYPSRNVLSLSFAKKRVAGGHRETREGGGKKSSKEKSCLFIKKKESSFRISKGKEFLPRPMKV